MRGRGLRRLLLALALTLVVLAVALVVIGEVVVRPAAEDQIAAGLADELGLTERPDVHIDGFPLVLRALQERIDGIDVSIHGQEFEGLRVDAVDLRVDEVRFASSELLRGSGTVVITGGGGRADVRDVDLTAYLATVGLPVDVVFDDGAISVSGVVGVDGAAYPVEVSGELVYDGVRLQFTPTSVDAGAVDLGVDLDAIFAAARSQFAFTAPVPELRGVRLTQVEIGDGVASIGATFETLTVEY